MTYGQCSEGSAASETETEFYDVTVECGSTVCGVCECEERTCTITGSTRTRIGTAS